MVTEDWYFANHRLDHAKALLERGFEVHVATRSGARTDEIRSAGCVVHEIQINRDANVARLLVREVPSLAKLILRVRPRIVHAVALKPVTVSAALIPIFLRVKFVLAISGLGVSGVTPTRSLKAVCFALRQVSRSRRVRLLFQNTVDRDVVGAAIGRTALIPGVGVDTSKFKPEPMPESETTRLAFLGRSVRSKGLLDIAGAAEALVNEDFQFDLYLTPDPTSPGSLSESELATLASSPGVRVHEATSDSAAALNAAHAALLPSHAGEGVSKFSLESLACGRPLIASDSAGNSFVVDDGKNGWLFEPANVEDLVMKLRLLRASRSRLDSMSHTCRANALERHSLEAILPAVIQLHEQAVGP